MTTQWIWRIFLFVPASDVTAPNRNTLAQIYVDGGSGQSLADELGMFDSVVRLSATGEEPATVFGINLTAKQGMKDDFLSFFASLSPQTVWAALANTAYGNHADGEVLAVSDTLPANFVGQVVSWNQALNYLENQYGLLVIQPADVLVEPEAQPEAVTLSQPEIDALVADPLREKEDRVIDFPDADELRDRSPAREVEAFEERQPVEVAIVAEVDPEAFIEPAPLPQGTRLIFGRPVKLYDPEFAPTAAVMRLVDRVRNG